MLCYFGSAHYSVVPSLADTTSFHELRSSRQSLSQCRRYNLRLSLRVFEFRLPLPWSLPYGRHCLASQAITYRSTLTDDITLRVIAAFSAPVLSQSGLHRDLRSHDTSVTTALLRNGSPHTQVGDSSPRLRLALRLYLRYRCVVSFTDCLISIVKEQILASRCHPLCWGRPSSVGVRATSDERNTNG